MRYNQPEPPLFADAPQYAERRGYVVPTPAEVATGMRRCIVCGRWPAQRPVFITARPNGGAGGYARYLTPHRVCHDDADVEGLLLNVVARAGEQALVREAAAAENWWKPDEIVLGVAAGDQGRLL